MPRLHQLKDKMSAGSAVISYDRAGIHRYYRAVLVQTAYLGNIAGELGIAFHMRKHRYVAAAD